MPGADGRLRGAESGPPVGCPREALVEPPEELRRHLRVDRPQASDDGRGAGGQERGGQSAQIVIDVEPAQG